MLATKFRKRADLPRALKGALEKWGGMSELARIISEASDGAFVIHAAHVKSWLQAGNVPLHILPYVCQVTDLKAEELNGYLTNEFRRELEVAESAEPVLRLRDALRPEGSVDGQDALNSSHSNPSKAESHDRY